MRAAIKRASLLSRSEKDGHNLALICVDFLATNDFGKADDPDAVKRYLGKVDALLGIRLVAFEAKTLQLVYGAAALKVVSDSLDVEQP